MHQATLCFNSSDPSISLLQYMNINKKSVTNDKKSSQAKQALAVRLVMKADLQLLDQLILVISLQSEVKVV